MRFFFLISLCVVGITSRLRVVLYKSRFHILSLLKRKVTCSGLLVFCGCLVYRISERFSSQFAHSLCNPNPWGIGLWIFSYEFLFALDTYVQNYRRFQSSTIVTYLIISAVQMFPALAMGGSFRSALLF